MKLILHDLTDEDFNKITNKISEETKVICQKDNIKKCLGCFSCWIKTPGKCILHDEYNQMGQLLSDSNEVIVISKCCYGSYSPFIKNLLDRSISYVLPYFTIKNNEMHHIPRYNHTFKFSVFTYGQATDMEKETLKSLIERNCLNLNIAKYNFKYCDNLFMDHELKEALQ